MYLGWTFSSPSRVHRLGAFGSSPAARPPRAVRPTTAAPVAIARRLVTRAMCHLRLRSSPLELPSGTEDEFRTVEQRPEDVRVRLPLGLGVGPGPHHPEEPLALVRPGRPAVGGEEEGFHLLGVLEERRLHDGAERHAVL